MKYKQHNMSLITCSLVEIFLIFYGIHNSKNKSSTIRIDTLLNLGPSIISEKV